jgi:hypothetical protein
LTEKKENSHRQLKRQPAMLERVKSGAYGAVKSPAGQYLSSFFPAYNGADQGKL